MNNSVTDETASNNCTSASNKGTRIKCKRWNREETKKYQNLNLNKLI